MIGRRTFRSGKGRDEALAASLAGPLELSREEGSDDPIVLAGRHRGVAVQLKITPGGEVHVRVPLKASLPAGLRLSREPSVASAEAKTDLQLGDPELDRLLRIEAKNPAAAIRLLREPALRAPLLALFSHAGARLEADAIRVGPLSEVGVSSVRAVLGDVCALAPVLGAKADALEKARAAEIEKLRQEGAPGLNGRRFVAIDNSEFQRKKRLAAYERARRTGMRIGLPLIASGVLMAGVIGPLLLRWKGGLLPIEMLIFGSFVVSATGAYLMTRWSHCPECGHLHQRTRSLLSMLFTPEECANCGARLGE